MNRALLPALIASMFAAGGAMAADQELLFGPTGVVKETPAAKSRPAKPAVVASSEEAPVAPAPKVKKAKVEKAEQEPVVAQAPAPKAPKPVPEVSKPAPVVAKAPVEAPKPAPLAVVKPPVQEPVKVAPAPVAAAKPAPAEKVAVAPTPKAIPLPEIPAAKAPVAKPAPEIKVLPTIQPVAAVMPAMPSLSTVAKIAEGSDPLIVREALIAKMDQETNIGFFPAASGNGSTYDFLRYFLPLSNHLSQKTGILVNLIPERSIVDYGNRIMHQQYPAIFINAALAREASTAGYSPLVVGTEMLAAGYLVKADAPYKNIEDLKNVSLAWSRDSQAALLAMADLAKRDLAKANKYQDIGVDTREGAIKAVTSGAVNVSVMSFKDAEAAVASSKGALRILNASTTGASSGLWVRKDMVGTEYAKRLETAFLGVNPDATEPSAKQAAEFFAQGFGAKASFVRATDVFLKDTLQTIEIAKKSFPGNFRNLSDREQPILEFVGKMSQEEFRNSNLVRPAVNPVPKSDLKDAVAERDKVVKGMNQQTSVGFYPSAGGNGSTYDFLRNFLPLANHLSQKSGVLVNLVPERNLADYGSRIMHQQYPAVFINSALSRQATIAGYVPVVIGSEKIASGYLVKADSPFKTIDDIKKAKIAWSRDSQVALLAMADLSKRDLVKANDYIDIGVDGKEGALKALSSGAASVAVMSSKEADAYAEKSKGALRSLGAGTATPSSALWVRKDIAGTDYAKRLESALLSVSSESTDATAKKAAESFSNGYSARASFVAVPDAFSKEVAELIGSAKTGFPGYFRDLSDREQPILEFVGRMSVEEFKNANLVRAPFEPIR